MRKIAIYVLLIGIMPISAKAQIFAGNDTSMCNGVPVKLTATLNGVTGTTSYSFQQIAYTPQPFAGTMATEAISNKPFNFCDDCLTDSLPIGFTFCFLGKPHDYFYIASNGWISFTKGQPTNYTSAAIPSTNASVPKDCIMGPWQDWAPDNGIGQVLYQTTGITPNRKLVVSWVGVPMFQCTANLGTFQIVINETSNIIENYIQTKPNCLTWQGGTATQGVHDASGTIAYVVPGRNSTPWTANGEGWAFIPSGIKWYQGTTNIGIGPTVTVSPTTTTTYTAVVSLCGGGTASDSVIVKIGAPITANFTANPSVISLFDPVCNFTDQSNAAIQWQWNFGDGNNSVIQNPSNTYMWEGTFPVKLVVCNSDGCCDSTIKNILVQDDYTMYVPNAFTPDANGLNDFFSVKATGVNKSTFELRIFNRWGEQLFITQDINEPWRGTRDNSGEKILPEGVYVYHIKFHDNKEGNEHELIGRVTLLK